MTWFLYIAAFPIDSSQIRFDHAWVQAESAEAAYSRGQEQIPGLRLNDYVVPDSDPRMTWDHDD